MTRQAEPTPRPPVEQDIEQIATALRRLAQIGCAEDAALYERLGEWPRELHVGAPSIVYAVINPIAHGCLFAVQQLVAHLATLIGPAEAQAMAQSFVDEQRANPAVRATMEMLEGLKAKAEADAKAAAGPSPSRAVH